MAKELFHAFWLLDQLENRTIQNALDRRLQGLLRDTIEFFPEDADCLELKDYLLRYMDRREYLAVRIRDRSLLRRSMEFMRIRSLIDGYLPNVGLHFNRISVIPWQYGEELSFVFGMYETGKAWNRLSELFYDAYRTNQNLLHRGILRPQLQYDLPLDLWNNWTP